MGKSCLSHTTVIPFSLNLPVPCIVGLMTYLINYPKLTKKWLLGGSLGKTTECSTFFSSWVLNTLRNKQNSGIVKVAQSCLTLCNPMDCIVHGILHAIILEWVAFPFSRGSCQPRDRTQVSCIAGRFFTIRATREAQGYWDSWNWQEDREDLEIGRQWGGSGGWRQGQEPPGLSARKVGLEVTEQGRNELRYVSDSLRLR